MTLRKSLLPFCGCLNVISGTSLDFSSFFLKKPWIATLLMDEGDWEYVLGFNEVTSLSELLPVEAGWCVEAWRVSLWLCFQKHARAQRFPVEIKMNLPSREECEGWDPAQVAFFLCKVSARKNKALSEIPISHLKVHNFMFDCVSSYMCVSSSCQAWNKQDGERNIMELNTFNLFIQTTKSIHVYCPQNKMQDCAATINRLNITGQRLLVS